MIKWVGHRGFRGPFAQNTVPAFIEGAKQGCFALECDVRISIDDVYYISHDDVFLDYLFTDPNLIGKLMSSYPWTELKAFELQGRFNESLYRGFHLASLEEYLTICKSYQIGAIIELKWTKGLNPNDTSGVPGLLALVNKHNMFDQSIFMSSMREVLVAIKNTNPDATIQLLTGSKTTTIEVAKWCVDHGFSIDALAQKLTPEIIALMHDHQLLVNSYTVNDNLIAKELIDLGVDMITSDIYSPRTFSFPK
ncbi:MAG: glycerophosphodiester phosphodiesterase family protein [Bacilli bacterium]